MPQYVLERQYLVPVYEHILVEAPSFEEACSSAVEESEHLWGDDSRTDYENARGITIERAVELSEQVDADEHSLSHFLYDAGLDPLPIPGEFADEVDGPSEGVGFV